MSLEVDRLRAVAHPTRLQILSLLTGAELSAAEVGRELDISQPAASYHLRQLAAAGLLEVAGEQKVRGGIAKLYRHPWRDNAEHGQVHPTSRRLYIEAVAGELVRRADARTAGPGVVVDAELWVDPDVWAEAVDAVVAVAGRLHDAAKPPRAPGAVRTNMTGAMFAMRRHGTGGGDR
ncbi:MAG: ArsR/SmtB family transcription factor [Nocardioidaceae bacterium]